MSISPYQYRMLTQSLAVVRPNFNCFCISLSNQLDRYEVSCFSLVKSVTQLENEFFRFIHQCVGLTLEHSNLVAYLKTIAPTLRNFNVSERDISIMCNCFLATLQLHLGRQYTLAMRNAWRRLLHVIANILNHELNGRTNVVSLMEHRIKKSQAC